ncbi:MAG: hypothetical protein DELT_02059 [Desulfovibrio sp.]
MKKKALMTLAAIAAVAVAFWYWQLPVRIVAESARLEGGVIGVSVSVPGTVREAYITAGEGVAEGQPLFALDKSAYETYLAKERRILADIASTIPANVLVSSPTAAQGVAPGKPLAALRSEEDDARKRVEVASHVFAAANIDLSRYDAAGKKNGPERQRLLIKRDEAAIGLKTAKDAHEKISYARAQREALDKTLLANDKLMSAGLAARIAEYQAQISQVRLAEQNLAATVVTSPVQGKVAFMAATSGTRLAAGDVPVSIVPNATKDIWVEAFFTPEEASALRVNQECVVVFDGTKEVKGLITAIEPPSQEEKRFATHIVLDQNGDVPGSMIGKGVSVHVPIGRMPVLSGLMKQ